MEIDNAIEEFINFVRIEREYSEHSVTAYAKDLSELSIYAHDEKVPDDVKALDFFTLRGFITTLYDRELSKSSIERKISTIKSFFKFLYRRGIIEEKSCVLMGKRCVRIKGMKKNRHISYQHGAKRMDFV